MPAAQDFRGQDSQSAGATGGEPGQAGLAAGGAVAAPQQERLGGVLPAIKSRHGSAAAITAAAHKLARLVYSLLKHGTDYVAQEVEQYEAKYRERKLRTIARQAQELGFNLVPAIAAAGG